MSGCTLHRARFGVSTGILATALSTLMIFAGTGGALGAGTTWTVQESPSAALSGGQLEAVSCSSPRACTAVGKHLDTSGITLTLAERWNGSAWRQQPTPSIAADTTPSVAPELLGVSCPARRFCAAVGSFQEPFEQVSLAETWNGFRWTREPFKAPADSDGAGLTQVSCTWSRFCEAVGSYFDEDNGQTTPLAAEWNGTSWTAQPTPSLTTTAGFTAVSCTSPKSCEAWGGGNAGNPGPEVAEYWNGTSWQLQTVPSDAAAVDSVSCTSATFCEAVATGTASTPSVAYNWNGSQWSAQTLPSSVGSAGLNGVSCTSPRFCETVGVANVDGNYVGVTAVWNGSGWTAQTSPDPAGDAYVTLNAVSCASASSCEAAGEDQVVVTANDPMAFAEAWNGSSWALQHAAAPPGATDNYLTSVSCPSASFCMAVGNRQDSAGGEANLAEIWNGTSWVLSATPDLAGQSGTTAYSQLSSVSCVSASFCEAVGTGPNGPDAALWNGKSWTLQSRPGEDVEPEELSCTTVDFCMASVGYGDIDIWNGSSWSAGTSVTGFSYVGSVSCLSASFCEVVGEGPTGENAAAWNGTSWTAQATPGPASNSPNSVSCTSASSCEAVGQTLGQNGYPVTFAEAWNGSTWTVQSAAAPVTTMGSSLAAVSCTSASSCTAVGQYQSSSVTNFGEYQTLAEVWNGTSWTIATTPDPSSDGQNLLNSVSCGASQACTAAGQYSDPGGVDATLIEAGD
jgi:hypothetical protein